MRRVKLAIALRASPDHRDAYRIGLDSRAVQLLLAAGWQMLGSAGDHFDLRPDRPLKAGATHVVVDAVVPSCSEIYALALECHQVGLAIDGHLYGWPYHYEPAPGGDYGTAARRPEQFHMGDALWGHTVMLEDDQLRETLHHENIVEVLEEGRDGGRLPEDHSHPAS
jgi:hypothetical protein